MKWFRMYAEAVDDEKLRMLAFEDRWHYVAVLCMKSAGILDNQPSAEIRDKKVAIKLGVSDRECAEIRRRLREAGLISATWQPLGWEKRQYKHDTSAERTRAWRERKAEVGDGHCDVTVTGSDTDTDTETEKEKRGARGARLPRDWPLTEERAAYARRHGVDPAKTHLNFCQFWWAKAGAGARKADWDLTWQTWVRTDAERNPRAKAAVAKAQANEGRWDGLRARADRIGFRPPTSVESPDVYETSLKLAERDALSARPIGSAIAALAGKVKVA